MAGRTIIAERTIAAPRAEVFQWFSDASNWPAARLVLSGKLAVPGQDGGWGLGARREILLVGSWYDEEIVAYDPPARYDYRIRRSVPPLRRELGRMEFQEVPVGTRVIWTRWVTVPLLLGPVLALIAPVARWVFGHILAAGDRELTRTRRTS
jgi:hypothetical protein